MTPTPTHASLPPREDLACYGDDYSIPVLTDLTRETGRLFRYDYHSRGWVFSTLSCGPAKQDYAEYDLDRITCWAPVPELAVEVSHG